jgi:predicted exporter
VKAAVSGVIREAVIAACLTALMILLFLGSWRSTIIIAISIPLSILTSVMALSFLGQTINIMTLGGLALAVDILVDDVYAPFDGGVTARNTDVGDLINAGAGTPTTELFHMAATKTLRIYVAVPAPSM